MFDCFGVLAADGWTPFKRQYITGNHELEQAVRRLGKEVDEGKRSYDDMITETAHLVNVGEAEVRAAVEHKVPNEELFAYIKAELKPRYKIGMLSNASYNVLEFLFTPEQAALLDAVTLSYEAGLTKPDRQMYELMADRLGVDLGEVLMVDDQTRHCQGALEAGMQALLYHDFAQFRRELQPLLVQ